MDKKRASMTVAASVGFPVLFVGFVQAQSLEGILGKWSDSADKKTCEISVGSSPDVATLYQFTPRYVAFYEIECLIQDASLRTNGLNLSIDCFKGGGARWFEKLAVRKLDANRLGLTFYDRKPPVGRDDETQVILNHCPADKTSESPKSANNVSQWTHNGSTVTFQENSGSFEIDYLKPRKGMMDVGVRTETMLFFGNREGDTIRGKAYTFHPRCGPLPYDVQGTLSSGAGRLTLSGLSPRVDSKCEVIKGVLEAITFERMH